MKQYEADRDVLRFHFHDLPEMLEKLKDRQLDRVKFSAEPSFTVKHKYFITDDEKNKLVKALFSVILKTISGKPQTNICRAISEKSSNLQRNRQKYLTRI